MKRSTTPPPDEDPNEVEQLQKAKRLRTSEAVSRLFEQHPERLDRILEPLRRADESVRRIAERSRSVALDPTVLKSFLTPPPLPNFSPFSTVDLPDIEMVSNDRDLVRATAAHLASSNHCKPMSLADGEIGLSLSERLRDHLARVGDEPLLPAELRRASLQLSEAETARQDAFHELVALLDSYEMSRGSLATPIVPFMPQSFRGGCPQYERVPARWVRTNPLPTGDEVQHAPTPMPTLSPSYDVTPPSIGTWSVPMSKDEMARRYVGKKNARFREIAAVVEEYCELRRDSARRWRLRVDRLPPEMAARFTVLIWPPPPAQ